MEATQVPTLTATAHLGYEYAVETIRHTERQFHPPNRHLAHGFGIHHHHLRGTARRNLLQSQMRTFHEKQKSEIATAIDNSHPTHSVLESYTKLRR